MLLYVPIRWTEDRASNDWGRSYYGFPINSVTLTLNTNPLVWRMRPQSVGSPGLDQARDRLG